MDNTSFAPGNNSINNSTPPPSPFAPESSPKHFLNKKFVITFLILILLGAGAYAGIWYWQKQQLAQEVVPTLTPRPSATPDPTAGWKTYANTQYGFEVKYPTNFALENNLQKVGGYLGAEPAFIKPGEKLVAIKVPDTYPANSDFSEMFVLLSVNKNLSKTECLSYNKVASNGVDLVSVKMTNTKVINGETFYSAESGGVGAGHQADDRFYHAFKNNTCFEVLLGLRTSTGADGTVQLNYDDLFTKLDSVLSTFKFTDSVDTSTWKTYTNGNIGFSFKYPADMSIQETDTIYPEGSNMHWVEINLVNGDKTFSLGMSINNPGRGGNLAANPITREVTTSDNKTISYQTGLSQSMGDDTPGPERIWQGQFESNRSGYLFEFTTQTGADETELVEKIISTFKFTQ